MKRLPLLFSLLVASLSVACGGGGSSFVPPPPIGNFSNASLKGQYAISMSGRELCAGVGSFFIRAGSLTADGNGNITGGVEDVNTCTGVLALQFTGGTYSIQADGRGTLSLTNRTGTTNYSIALASTARGFIVQTDVNSTSSGSFQKQDPTAFSLTKIAGGYVFDFNGVSSALNPESIVGRFTADGGGGISEGLFDSNEAGTLSGQQVFPAGAFYQLDPAFGTSGRGTANIAGHNFAFYIVDGTRLRFLGTGFPEAFVGDAFAQQSTLFTASSLNGGYAFFIGGASTSGPIASSGRFTADGAGNLTSVFLDENNNGTGTFLPSGTVTGSYTVDANGFGGGTLTWTDTKAGVFSFIFYLMSPTEAVFQETDNKITSDGTLLAQAPGPVTMTALAGNYAFGWSGVSSDEEDFAGRMTLASAASGNASGIMDFNEFGPGKQFFNIPWNGSLTISGQGTGPNTFTVTTAVSPATTFNFTAYVVNKNTVFLVGVDGNRVIAGSASRQP